ncbi:MAG TPA: hypothetical protein VGN83_24315 [Falsiroseomonas sp.]|jgi:hypothetical protein|nr:hypothetical protein [Falsiroseomonas sp.]
MARIYCTPLHNRPHQYIQPGGRGTLLYVNAKAGRQVRERGCSCVLSGA